MSEQPRSRDTQKGSIFDGFLGQVILGLMFFLALYLGYFVLALAGY